jgi:hypothetical protein
VPSYDFFKLYGSYQNLKIWYFGYHSCVRTYVTRVLRTKQVDLWVRVGGTPFPHIHTYISQDQACPWCTQLQILDLPVLELNPLNFHIFFFDFPPAKTVLFTRSSKSPQIYTIINVFVFKRARICKFSPAARTA